MDEIKILPFTKLTNFQQWVIFYLQTKIHMNPNIEYEINDFCDKTKDEIDMQKYDQDIKQLQIQFDYFLESKLIQIVNKDVIDLNQTGSTIPAGSAIFTKKGELYCHKEIQAVLNKFNSKETENWVRTKSAVYQQAKEIGNSILYKRDFTSLAHYIIENKENTMNKIITFGKLMMEYSNSVNG